MGKLGAGSPNQVGGFCGKVDVSRVEVDTQGRSFVSFFQTAIAGRAMNRFSVWLLFMQVCLEEESERRLVPSQ